LASGRRTAGVLAGRADRVTSTPKRPGSAGLHERLVVGTGVDGRVADGRAAVGRVRRPRGECGDRLHDRTPNRAPAAGPRWRAAGHARRWRAARACARVPTSAGRARSPWLPLGQVGGPHRPSLSTPGRGADDSLTACLRPSYKAETLA